LNKEDREAIPDFGDVVFSGIRQGDKLECLNCKKLFNVAGILISTDLSKEIILCPHCKRGIDVKMYHREKGA